MCLPQAHYFSARVIMLIMLIAMTTATVYEITLKTEGQCGNSQISLYQQLKIIWDRERRQAKLDSEC